MQGRRHEVVSADGTSIGLLTAGTGTPLLVVHGGMAQLERWLPLWGLLASRFTVTAMDRRGRGSSGDGPSYDLAREHEDIRAVASELARTAGAPVDVFAHSYGATAALGAATGATAVRRLVLYEPPGPATVPADWVDRATALVDAGRPGPAMASFLVEVVGLAPAEVAALREGFGAYDVLGIVSATLPREAQALRTVDLTSLARDVHLPVLLLLGQRSPRWAAQVAHLMAEALDDVEVRTLPGQGHEAVDRAPPAVFDELTRFLDRP